MLFAADQNFIDENGIFSAQDENGRIGLVLIHIVVTDDELNVVLIVRARKSNVVRFGEEHLAFRAVQGLSFAIANADAA